MVCSIVNLDQHIGDLGITNNSYGNSFITVGISVSNIDSKVGEQIGITNNSFNNNFINVGVSIQTLLNDGVTIKSKS